MRIPVSQYFSYNTFGILGNYDAKYHYVKYVCTGTVGTGFFIRDTESQSYNEFVKEQRKITKRSYWKMLFGKEFSFKKEIARVNSALTETNDPLRRRIFDSYLNCLTLASNEEVIERIADGLRKKLHGRPNSKYSSPLKHYKNRIQGLEHEIRLTQVNVKDLCTEEQLEAYGGMVMAFRETCTVRRIWDLSVPGKDGHRHKQVFWDLGVFDFIQSPWYLPVMRDGNGLCYYWLPTCVIKARTSVDFDILPYSSLSMMHHPVGDGTQSDINLPEMGIAFRFSNIEKVEGFYKAFINLQAKQ